MTMKPKLVTIGVFGFDEARFFQALQRAEVELFCDIRRRRGVRGAEYAFVNSQRLQARLSALGIRYLHRLDLAPPQAIRALQNQADQASRQPKRQRTVLDAAYVAAYETACLATFEPQSLLDDAGAESQVIALFCVEREPAACHRSLVAEKLRQTLGVEVEHLLPPLDDKGTECRGEGVRR
jgi:uncharacterized protein (DUF488 family)